MTLVFRITMDDDLARAVVGQLQPKLRPRNGATAISGNLVRHILSTQLRERCNQQINEWVRNLPK